MVASLRGAGCSRGPGRTLRRGLGPKEIGIRTTHQRATEESSPVSQQELDLCAETQLSSTDGDDCCRKGLPVARMIQQGARRHSVNRAKQTRRKMVPQSVQKPVITRSAKEKRRRQADVEKLRRWLARVDTWKTGVTFPGLKDGDRNAEEFVMSFQKHVTKPIQQPWRT